MVAYCGTQFSSHVGVFFRVWHCLHTPCVSFSFSIELVLLQCCVKTVCLSCAASLTIRWSSILPLAVNLSQLCIGCFQPGLQLLHPLKVEYLRGKQRWNIFSIIGPFQLTGNINLYEQDQYLSLHFSQFIKKIKHTSDYSQQHLGLSTTGVLDYQSGF